MQFKLSALVTAALATSVIANSAPSCSTGPIQCCNSVVPASNAAASQLLGLLGVVVQNLNVLIGITCAPISVIGAGGNSCSAQTVCCENDNFNGVIAVGCTPININV